MRAASSRRGCEGCSDVMTCADAAELLDAFVDAELPGPKLVEVAKHVATCPACDTAVREIEALHEAVERVAREQTERLDLSGVWPAVEAGMARADARRAWARRLRAAPAWGAVMALAASAVLWLRPGTPEPARVAARPARPNQAVIERINSDGRRFELRRERKLGTTLIMVSAVDPEVIR